MSMLLEAATPAAPAAASNVTSIVVCVFSLLAFAVAIVLYLLPFIIAKRRNHLQATAILLLNLFLGWSFIGWVIALIWAVTKEKPQNTDKTE